MIMEEENGDSETELDLGLSLGKNVFDGRASRIGDCRVMLTAEDLPPPLLAPYGSPILSPSSSTDSSSPPSRRTAISASSGSLRPRSYICSSI